MLRYLIVLLVVAPALEIWVLLETGRLIGGWQTFALILLTGFAGALLAKREGRRVYAYARHELAQGTIPTSAILDGICIFAGGLLLLTPGLLSDIVGLLLVLPGTRNLFKGMLEKFIRRRIENGQIRYFR